MMITEARRTTAVTMMGDMISAPGLAFGHLCMHPIYHVCEYVGQWPEAEHSAARSEPSIQLQRLGVKVCWLLAMTFLERSNGSKRPNASANAMHESL
jgi:hypothetical protein